MKLSETTLDPKLVDALEANKITTVDQLEDFLDAGSDLVDLDGIGKARKEKILAWHQSQLEEPIDEEEEESSEADAAMDGPQSDPDPDETDSNGDVGPEATSIDPTEEVELVEEPEPETAIPFLEQKETIIAVAYAVKANQRMVKEVLLDFNTDEEIKLKGCFNRELEKRSRLILDVYNQYQQRKIDERKPEPAQSES